jgi:ribosomal protein S6
LRVSSIVYKDSKLRHNRHEGDHLFNTFENEAKLRKEVRNKINSNPDILKKHLLVADSR